MNQINATRSQLATIESFKSNLPRKSDELTAFETQNIVGSRHVLVTREFGKGAARTHESVIVGPRGKVKARTLVPSTKQ